MSWTVTPERTDYRTDYNTDYDTSRKTDYVTNLPTDTPLPSFLPTNLRYDYPTTLPTNLRTDYNEQTQYKTKVGIYITYIKGSAKTTYTFGKGNKEIKFVPVTGDQYTYSYQSGTNNKGSPIYSTATITGVKASLAKALAAAGFPPGTAVSYANNNAQGVRDVRDENDRNVALNAENRQKNEENAKINQENAALNDENYRINSDNANKNIQIEQDRFNIQTQNENNRITNETNFELNTTNSRLNQEARELNQKHTQFNQENTYLNTSNTLRNNLYNKTLQIADSTQGGDYVDQRNRITVEELVNSGMKYEEAVETVDYIRSQFKDFYRTEKLTIWDSNLGAQPPYADYLIKEAGVKPDAVTGTFDPKYYKEQNPELAKAYAEAVAKDDLDIIERYGENNFYWQHYTNIGRAQGLRGNPEEATAQANSYIEEGPTDAEIQQIRDLQLGVDQDTITQRLLNITEVNNEWTKARQGDPYWTALAKEKYLDVENADEFAVLFRLSDREQDKQIALNYNINAGSGITELEQAINDAIGAKAEVDVKKLQH